MSSDLIGISPRFRAVLDAIEMVAGVESAVLVQGETGTGKEVVAHAIHNAGPRRQQRFVALNCAAIPATLLESELFGHERGAFTGAVNQALGRFEAADRGTLFLDEVGDLPLELQPKLLRVLQEQQFERLGGSRTLQVDVRVIAATNQDLWKMVQERRFRADLYYRLNVFPIALPPLRERIEDIPLLVRYFVQKFAERQGKTIEEIPQNVMRSLMQYHWPGNIRELQNCIERAVIFSDGRTLQQPGFESTQKAAAPLNPEAVVTLAEAERAHILSILDQTNWVIGGRNGAATRLGMARTTLIYRMRKLGIATAPVHAIRESDAGHRLPQWQAMSSQFAN